MADEKPQVTEEQVKTANEAEEAKWQGDYKEEDLVIPYKREDSSEGTSSKSRLETDDSKQYAGDIDDSGSGDANDEEVQQISEPVSAVTVEDPGEYQPADYSFEVTLKDGKTVKISTPDEAEKIADDPDNFETPKQLMDFINKQNKMNRNLDKEYEKWESQKKTFTEQLETETERRETIETYVGEFNYLVSKGLIPTVPKEYVDADWNDPEIAKQPGVKEQMALLDYMTKENAVRAKAKVKPITSIVDAYNAWQMDEGHQKSEAKKKADEEAHRAAGEARKTAGARVAGVSASNQAPYVPKGIAVGNPNVFKRSENIWAD